MAEDRPVAPEAQAQEEKINQSLRPTDWDGYYGQALVKENIQILIASRLVLMVPLPKGNLSWKTPLV